MRFPAATSGTIATRPSAWRDRLKSDLSYATIKDIFDRGLHQYLDTIQVRLCEIAGAMLETYCDWREMEEVAQGQTQQ